MARNKDGKLTVNLLDICVVCFFATLLSLLVSMTLFWLLLGVTLLLFCVCIIAAWDEILAWWSTRK